MNKIDPQFPKKAMKCVGRKAQNEKCLKSLQKQLIGITINLQNH